MSVKTVGIVGCGHISRKHGEALRRLTERFQVVGCADPSEQARAAFADQFGIEHRYEDLDSLMREAAPDVVLLATWPSQHEEQVISAIEAGAKWILCEKSLALSAGSAGRMSDAARRAGATLVEAFMWRHHPRTLKAHELLRSGRIGTLRRVRAAFHSAPFELTNWRSKPELGGGVPFDYTCYPMNALGAFIDAEAVEVVARGRRSEAGVWVELDASIRYEDGIVAVIDSSYTSSYHQIIELQGDDGVILISNPWTSGDDTRIELLLGSPWTDSFSREEINLPAADPFYEQWSHLADVMNGGAELRFAVEESIRNIGLLEKVLAVAGTRAS